MHRPALAALSSRRVVLSLILGYLAVRFVLRLLTSPTRAIDDGLVSLAGNVAFAIPVNGIAGLGPPQAAWATALDLTGFASEPAIVTPWSVAAFS